MTLGTQQAYFVVPRERHDQLVEHAFRHRGYTRDETPGIVRLCAEAARHGIRTHNAVKALHLDELFGSRAGGCVPGASLEKLPSRFPASQVWNAHKKMGPPVAYEATETCMQLADQYGVGMVSVDNAFHYFWGGGYILEAARRGYIAYTQCTAMLAEVVPFAGKRPTLGTNPHSWAFPTVDSVGFPILIDWATSAVAMGRVQQFKREGLSLPPGSAVDADGEPTTDPNKVVALLPFGAHKGYGLGLINELWAGFIGGSNPTARGKFTEDGKKHSPCFFFMVIHPDAISSGSFCSGRSRTENLRDIVSDILGPGNESAILPGQIEAAAAGRADQEGGLLFTQSEIEAFNHIAEESSLEPWRLKDFRQVP